MQTSLTINHEINHTSRKSLIDPIDASLIQESSSNCTLDSNLPSIVDTKIKSVYHKHCTVPNTNFSIEHNSIGGKIQPSSLATTTLTKTLHQSSKEFFNNVSAKLKNLRPIVKQSHDNCKEERKMEKPMFVTTVKSGTFLEPPPDMAVLLGLRKDSFTNQINSFGAGKILTTTTSNRPHVLYSFSSKPRIVTSTMEARTPLKNSFLKLENRISKRDTTEEINRISYENADGSIHYGNAMYDRRVARGSNFATLRPNLTSTENVLSRQAEARRRAAVRQRAQIRARKLRMKTPPPVDGRKHGEMQTEKYLEELTERPSDKTIACQVDLPIEIESSPSISQQTNCTADAETQVSFGDLPEHDDDVVHTVVTSIVKKILEEAILEINEEIENFRNYNTEKFINRSKLNGTRNGNAVIITIEELRSFIRNVINNKNFNLIDEQIVNSEKFMETIVNEITNLIKNENFLSNLIEEQLDNWTIENSKTIKMSNDNVNQENNYKDFREDSTVTSDDQRGIEIFTNKNDDEISLDSKITEQVQQSKIKSESEIKFEVTDEQNKTNKIDISETNFEYGRKTHFVNKDKETISENATTEDRANENTEAETLNFKVDISVNEVQPEDTGNEFIIHKEEINAFVDKQTQNIEKETVEQTESVTNVEIENEKATKNSIMLQLNEQDNSEIKKLKTNEISNIQSMKADEQKTENETEFIKNSIKQTGFTSQNDLNVTKNNNEIPTENANINKTIDDTFIIKKDENLHDENTKKVQDNIVHMNEEVKLEKFVKESIFENEKQTEITNEISEIENVLRTSNQDQDKLLTQMKETTFETNNTGSKISSTSFNLSDETKIQLGNTSDMVETNLKNKPTEIKQINEGKSETKDTIDSKQNGNIKNDSSIQNLKKNPTESVIETSKIGNVDNIYHIEAGKKNNSLSEGVQQNQLNKIVSLEKIEVKKYDETNNKATSEESNKIVTIKSNESINEEFNSKEVEINTNKNVINKEININSLIILQENKLNKFIENDEVSLNDKQSRKISDSVGEQETTFEESKENIKEEK